MFCSGRIFGFLLGSVLAGSGLYYYVVDEYKVSNELLTEDVYVSLQCKFMTSDDTQQLTRIA
jgi:hypothetical protein